MDGAPSATPSFGAAWLPASWNLGRRRLPLSGLAVFLPGPVLQVPSGTLLRLRELGASIADGVGGATHCVVRAGLSEADVGRGTNLGDELRRCESEGVPVVEETWVDAVAALGDGADWSAVGLAQHVPPVMALLGEPRPDSPAAAARSTAARKAPRLSREAVLTAPAAAAPGGARGRGPLVASLGETMAFLRRAHPDQLEADQLARAIENSLLDFAIALRSSARGEPSSSEICADAAQILGVRRGASAAAVRAAYRRKALGSHPDRGGTPGAFTQLQRAYREMLAEAEAGAGRAGGAGGKGTPSVGVGGGRGELDSEGRAPLALEGPRVDAELKEQCAAAARTRARRRRFLAPRRRSAALPAPCRPCGRGARADRRLALTGSRAPAVQPLAGRGSVRPARRRP